MTIRLIGAGFGRTGTLSLKAALETLGYGPCYHMYELLQHFDHAAGWRRAAEGDLRAMRGPLDGYASTVDWPGCAFWRELAAEYPSAPIVLSVRPPAKWYASFRETVGALLAAGQTEDPTTVPPEFSDVLAVRDLIVRDRSFGPDFDVDDEDAVLAAYHRHNHAVTTETPAERLLVFDVADGWEPLCRFLEVPVPTVPFPHANDRDQFRTLFGLDTPDVSFADTTVDALQQRFATDAV